jgi:hypothetical protein
MGEGLDFAGRAAGTGAGSGSAAGDSETVAGSGAWTGSIGMGEMAAGGRTCATLVVEAAGFIMEATRMIPAPPRAPAKIKMTMCTGLMNFAPVESSPRNKDARRRSPVSTALRQSGGHRLAAIIRSSCKSYEFLSD